MDNKLIDQKRDIGDWKIVAMITDKSSEACRMAWTRKEGKTFEIVKEALIKVIENREQFVESERKIRCLTENFS